MGLHCTPACRGARQWAGRAACTGWSEFKAAEAVEGSSGVVHMAAVPSALSQLEEKLLVRCENNTSSAQGNPWRNDTWFCNFQCNSETLHHSLLIKELAALTLQALALLSVSQPVWFSGCSFPSFQAVILPESDMASPLCYHQLCPLVAGSNSTFCIGSPACCCLAESHWGHFCRHRLQTCEVLQRHHVPMPLHGLLMDWCTSKPQLSSKVSFYALLQNMTLCSS